MPITSPLCRYYPPSNDEPLKNVVPVVEYKLILLRGLCQQLQFLYSSEDGCRGCTKKFNGITVKNIWTKHKLVSIFDRLDFHDFYTMKSFW
jgi:hypothetical protein